MKSALMSARMVNTAILLLVSLELASGLGSFLVGRPAGEWVFWVHSCGGLALVALLGRKFAIASRSYRRRGLLLSTALSGAGGLLLLGSLLTGVLWTFAGTGRVSLPVLGDQTGLGLHVALSLLVVPFFLVHVRLRRPRRKRRPDAASRRAALGLIALLAAGFVLWRIQQALSALLALSGSHLRFTGSREEASFAGNVHPVTQWLTDSVPEIEPGRWQLKVTGEVERELTFSYEDLLKASGANLEATLDCTGGWYTVQRWSGPPLANLLNLAKLKTSAESLVVRSATGYARRFSLEEAQGLLLATRVEGKALSAGHGFPLRLVAPDRRGYCWVKWITTLEVSREPGWLKPPLPLQ